MRTIRQLAIPQDTDIVEFPQGTIKNESESEDGTPVIREIFGDILTNIYKILNISGILPDGTEDTETTKYQIVDALKLWTNQLNDIEQILTLGGTVWSVPFNLDILPNKYVFISKASDNFDPLVSYTFKGSGATPTFPLTSVTGFNASDEILVIIDTSGVRVISLTQITGSKEQVFTPFGIPIAFNSTSIVKYESNGKLLSDLPSVDDLQQKIRTLSTDPLAEVMDMVILKGFVLCFTFLPNTITYNFFQFDINDLNTAINVPVTGIVIPVGSDNFPFIYTDGSDIYATNAMGTNSNDNDVSKLTYTPATPNITFVSTTTINAGFIKTSNVIIQAGFLFTFILSILKKYNLSSNTEIVVDNFDTIIGTIFNFDGSVYYSNGEVATKWTI